MYKNGFVKCVSWKIKRIFSISLQKVVLIEEQLLETIMDYFCRDETNV